MHFWICVLFVSIILSTVGIAQEFVPASRENFDATIDAVVNAEMKASHVPGFALVVVHSGKTILKRGYGLADVDQNREVDVDQTIFRIGSISKALTLLTLSRLIDDGRVDMQDDVNGFMDGIQNRSGGDTPVRLWNLLTHTTGFDQIGLDRQIYQFGLSLEERKKLRPTLTDFLSDGNLRRVSPPGVSFRYDTYAPTLAGAIIANVAGKSYKDAMQDEMFGPLGMNDSAVEVSAEDRNRLAIGYGYRGNRFVGMPYEVYVTTPASSIDATAADMGRLLEALTSDGANSHGRFLSEQMHARVMDHQFQPHPGFTGITHGLFESNQWGSGENAFAIRSIGHGGDMLGFKSFLIVFPEMKLGIFTVANRNREAGGGAVQIRRGIVNAVLKQFGRKPNAVKFTVPTDQPEVDLQPYVGEYCFGVYCHSCTAQEYARGGWRRPDSFSVVAEDGHLKIRQQTFLPIGNDVFVRSDGRDKIFFGRHPTSGSISFFVYQDEPYTFEKIRH